MSNSGGGGGLGEPADSDRTLADIERTLHDGVKATDPPKPPEQVDPQDP